MYVCIYYVQAGLNVFLSVYFSAWHLFFCEAIDRTNCSTNGTMTGTGKLFCMMMVTDVTGNELWRFYLVIVVIYAAIVVFTAVVLSLVVAASTVHGTIRFVLTNILIASITACFGIPLICLHDLITSISHLFSSANVSLQIFLAVMVIVGNGRSAFMAAFAVVMVVIIVFKRCCEVQVPYHLCGGCVDCLCGSWCHSCCPRSCLALLI